MTQTGTDPSSRYVKERYLRIHRACELWARRTPLNSGVRKFLRRLGNLLPDPTGTPDYIDWFDQHKLNTDAARRWKSVPFTLLESVPGMLARPERQFLYFAAREFYSGAGEILDVGAFLGASALALAAGLHDNSTVSHKVNRIYSYDFFEFADFHRSYLPGTKLKVGDDTLPLFHEFTNKFSGNITAIKGDICQQSWPHRDIEILFVDFTQCWQHHEFVVRNFYANLIPGQSLLIHQDYVYTVCYWLHIFMEYYKDFFDPISPLIRNGTAAWLYSRQLPPEAFLTSLNQHLSFADLLALFDRSLAKYNGTAAGLLKCARGRLILHRLGTGRAFEYATMLKQEYMNDPDVLPHVTILENDIRQSSSNVSESNA